MTEKKLLVIYAENMDAVMLNAVMLTIRRTSYSADMWSVVQVKKARDCSYKRQDQCAC